MADNFEDIPGYEGRYQINKLTHQIRSNTLWSKGNLLKVFTNRQGDKRVNLSKDGVVQQVRLATLIQNENRSDPRLLKK